MATVEITEHSGLRGGLPCRTFPILAKQLITFTSTGVMSSAFNSGTTFITAISTGAFRYVIGSGTVTSTQGHAYWPAEIPLDASVLAGHKFLALSTTTTSTP